MLSIVTWQVHLESPLVVGVDIFVEILRQKSCKDIAIIGTCFFFPPKKKSLFSSSTLR